MKTDYEKLAEMIKDIQFTMMTTLDHGKMHARPMATMKIQEAKDFDGHLWFFTKLDSAKVHEIEDRKEVSLAYSDPSSQRYVAVSGVASVTQDKVMMNELWTPTLKAWFPEGLKDPQIALISVEVTGAEVWDSPPSSVVRIFGMAKAIVTGQAYHGGGDHRSLDFKLH